jgi:carbamoyltransferase
MELGPRALGARSILADPRHPGMRDRINQQIKQREMFRPFAPAVLESKVSEYFDMDYASPFMLEVGNVTSSIPLPAVTHVDGSARVQTVAADVAPRFAALLAELKRLSGCAVVLNTSFNMNDEPIVCTPLDALRCFARSGLDLLVLGDFIIERSGLPDFWAAYLPLWQPQMAGSKDGGGHDVYSFF